MSPIAGRGPAPKDPSKRARRNADPIPQTVIPLVRGSAPQLPDTVEWHPETEVWWQMWQDSPLSANFTDADWNYLKDTARLHTAYWNGLFAVASELRQRVAKFGATPEDRARLRIFFADADKREADLPQTTSSTSGSTGSNRYAGLRAVSIDE